MNHIISYYRNIFSFHIRSDVWPGSGFLTGNVSLSGEWDHEQQWRHAFQPRGSLTEVRWLRLWDVPCSGLPFTVGGSDDTTPCPLPRSQQEGRGCQAANYTLVADMEWSAGQEPPWDEFGSVPGGSRRYCAACRQFSHHAHWPKVGQGPWADLPRPWGQTPGLLIRSKLQVDDNLSFDCIINL